VKRLLLVVLLLPSISPLLARAADVPSTQDSSSQYETDLNKRGDAVLKALRLADADKAARVKQIVMEQYRAIKDADDRAMAGASRDAKASVAKAKEAAVAAKKPLHDAFLQKLSLELTPEQVEVVKDTMTYNVVRVTYDAYRDELPQLTDAQQSYILLQLKDARDLAMDEGSSKDKHAVFNKAKGRINIYLSKEGYDLKKAEKEWSERRKARQATQPSK
jgi:outer membrane translocation and assembly module TamA